MSSHLSIKAILTPKVFCFLLLPPTALWLCDWFFRDLNFSQHLKVLPYLTAFHCLVLASLLWTAQPIRWLLAIVICGMVGSTTFLQLEYYQVYQSFIGPREVSVIVNNLEYWQNSNTIDVTSLVIGAVSATLALLLLYAPALLRLAPNVHLVWLPALALAGVLTTEKPAFPAEIQLLVSIQESYQLTKIERINQQHSQARRRANVSVNDAASKPNVLIILNESLRAENLQFYGYGRDTMPLWQQRFPNSLVFDAIANSAVTPTAVEAIMTGRYNVHADAGARIAPMIWDYFHSAGYQTFYSGSHWLQWNGHLDLHTLDERFVDFSNAPLAPGVSGGRPDVKSIEILEDQLSDTTQPFFAVLHTRDTHFVYLQNLSDAPFQPSEAHRDPDRINTLVNLYDNSIYNLDRNLDQFFEDLGPEKLDNTIIVFTSDHGEAFYEHGALFHTTIFWQQVLQVPFLVWLPPTLSISPEQRAHLINNQSALISNVDILPTVLELAGINTTDQFTGASLAGMRPEAEFLLSMSTQNYYALTHTRSREKVVVNNRENWFRVADLKQDPLENQTRTVPLTERLEYPAIMRKLTEGAISSGEFERSFSQGIESGQGGLEE